MRPKVIVAGDGDFADRAALEITARLRSALQERERAALALAGGGTPLPVYRRLAAGVGGLTEAEWARVDFVWSDERMVDRSDSRSNVETARRELLEPLGISAECVFEPPLGADADESARNYEATVRAVAGAEPPAIPRIDLVLLGVGSDGHTASLFPDSVVGSRRLVVATRSPIPPHSRISFSFALLSGAREIVFLVAGATKASVVRRILVEADGSLPATRIRPGAGRVTWVLEGAAARELSDATPEPD